MLIGCFVKHENLIYIKVFLFILYCEKLKLESWNWAFVLLSMCRLSVLIDLNEIKIVASYCFSLFVVWFTEANKQETDNVVPEATCKEHYQKSGASVMLWLKFAVAVRGWTMLFQACCFFYLPIAAMFFWKEVFHVISGHLTNSALHESQSQF